LELNVTSVDAGFITAVVVLTQVAESGNWVCDKCRSERLRLIEEKLQNAILQTAKQGRTRHWKNSYEQQQLEGKLAGGAG
jgi:hypothetical protein